MRYLDMFIQVHRWNFRKFECRDMGLGNVITLISCENALYYKKPIQYLYSL